MEFRMITELVAEKMNDTGVKKTAFLGDIHKRM
jgi:hypothetical protein